MLTMRPATLRPEISFVCRAHSGKRDEGVVTIVDHEWAYCAAGLVVAAPGHEWERIQPASLEEVRRTGGTSA